jgi:hypothetical protein
MTLARQINLYDPSLQRQREWLTLGNLVATGVVLAVAVGVAGYWTRQEVPALSAQTAANDAQLKTLRDQIALLGQQVAGRKPDPRIEQELGAAQLLLAVRGEVLDVLQRRLGSEAGSFADYLRGFARQAVPGLWLTGFAFDAASDGIEIQGRTIDPALLPEYIRRLNKEQAFQGHAFAALKLDEGKPDAPPAATATPGGQLVAAAKAPFHEFKLIPVRDDSGKSGKPQILTRAPGLGGSG